nr:trypsin, alkaline A-like [Helicoverpa armigera]
MRVIIALLASLVAAAAVPTSQRIVGGSATNIRQYPSAVALLYAPNIIFAYKQECGGTLLNRRSILTAAHCPYLDPPSRWRVHVGSSHPTYYGTSYGFIRFIYHPNFNVNTRDSDIAILRTASNVEMSALAQPAGIAGANYNLGDNQVVWAVGWGRTQPNNAVGSSQLQHVQIWTINQAICRQRYAAASRTITDNMLCAGVLDVGGRGQCNGDYGGPLYHNNVVVGISSFGIGCDHPVYPGVNVRVSRFTQWIVNNA